MLIPKSQFVVNPVGKSKSEKQGIFQPTILVRFSSKKVCNDDEVEKNPYKIEDYLPITPEN